MQLKPSQKEYKSVTAGAKCNHGKTWHQELEDKVESIKTHAHWCMKNCNSDPDNLRASLLNAVEHYKNHHDNCHEDSRCRKDQNYEPSKVIIQSQIAERLLMDALKKSILYRNAEDYFMALDTYFVESFNNVLKFFTTNGFHSGPSNIGCALI